ncbi:flagellar hook assembly protein FlgD [Radicibacter daui]|uniref:flagellar hook assembly protein FlgD n=1 Tax=Radicibacter daui TaxID=3064829 RepID=UPI004046C0DF
MSLAVTSSTSTTSSSSSSSSSSATDAYNTFLTLLTTELQNQNPVDPTDTTAFTNQLIALAGVEQQLITNSSLSTITDSLSSLTASNGVGYIGKTVTLEGDTTALQDGSANWSYDLDSTASDVTLTISDSDGNVVWTGSGDTSSGSHDLSWDGTGSDGTEYTSGDYTLTVSATDASGNDVDSTTYIKGKVTGVDSSSGTTELLIGDISVDMDDVIGIST